MRYFITLLILFGCLDGYSQKVAVRLNALPATEEPSEPESLMG